MGLIVDWPEIPESNDDRTIDDRTIKLQPHQDNQFLLCCPACSGDYLHHFRVDNYMRKEDDQIGTHLASGDLSPKIKINPPEEGLQDDLENVSMDKDMSENPSFRRHGLIISFFCECCGKISKLKIAQHKGQTIVEHTS